MLKLIAFLVAIFSPVAGFALEPLQPFQWDTVIEMPPMGDGSTGNQILHLKTTNKPYINDPEAVRFVKNNFANAKELSSDAETLRYASNMVKVKGVYIELGAGTGRSLNLLAALNPHTVVYGFDSFDGLPEPWVRADKTFEKGTFRFKQSPALLQVLQNVQLFQGVFAETLPAFVEQNLKTQPIALLHIDSELYSSAKTGLDAFTKNIVPGTIIVFDEFYNFPRHQDHEYKALKEFLTKNNYAAEYLAFNGQHQQVVVKIKGN